MYDFVSNIFELKSVPCDKQNQTSYYWCHKLAKAHTAQWARWCDDRTHLLIGCPRRKAGPGMRSGLDPAVPARIGLCAHAAQARTWDYPFKNRATLSRLRLSDQSPYDGSSLAVRDDDAPHHHR